jgi:Hint domain
MKTSGARRATLRAFVAVGAIAPVITFPKKSAAHPDHPVHPRSSQSPRSSQGHTSCLLKGTKIATPLGNRPVQELQIGGEVRTVAGPKKIRWIGYDKFTKETGKIWQESVMPTRVALQVARVRWRLSGSSSPSSGSMSQCCYAFLRCIVAANRKRIPDRIRAADTKYGG